ncbi:S1 RNA-binding domain-containing protein [Trebonia kvetii]|uniref:S1 RNA-binding domain-containing protein n=1 Tax=Trebonia kvetii TaxID=2480626 RepID=A0A6P2BQQ4_9ACTN|nr:S1 RNA-binding domain-containing protein [Trebonia kvetii]
MIKRIAAELTVRDHQVAAAVDLLDGGATVPFIARYRKEATGTLDDAQLRTLEERLRYLRELEERRTAILVSIDEQGKLTDELRAQIGAADTKARLEDLYLPYKPKRRTKAQIARENGLEPLAELLLSDPATDPRAAAEGFLNENVADAAAALDGARAILVERFAEDADLIGQLRERMWSRGNLIAKVREGKEADGRKYSDYFDFAEPFGRLKAHRVLAMFRAEKEEVLDLTLDPSDEGYEPTASGLSASYEQPVADKFGISDEGRPADRWLCDTVRWAWRTRILVHLGIDLRMRLWQAAEAEAVNVFAANLKDLLLAAPAGQRSTMGLDPGFRTGVKVAVVDATGKVVATHTIYPHVPHHKWDESLHTLGKLAKDHDVELIAIGNGTASRETDKLALDLIQASPELNLTKVVVSEAGASVYSASAYASGELPDLDVSLRGAVSIARRLQDPLAELVKIDPKSIGVGQYQHDVSGSKLERSLDAVVEDAVNAVGVDVNTASRPLLSRVSGITDSLAGAIVAHRDANGAFGAREQLRAVPRLGPKAFEQCAGFLRIRGGADPLDASGVHPESYPVVRRIMDKTHTDVATLIGNAQTLRSLNPAEFTDAAFGLPTVTDILKELEKPGRDPRPEFQTATFAEGVHTLGDLEPGMVLEGVVTNVAAFGAFVDIGVHQDGLVHVSAMSQNFVADPRDVAKSGDVVRVKVLSVDIPRNRISLTMRLQDEGEAHTGGGSAAGGRSNRVPRESSGTGSADTASDRGARPGGERRGGPGGDRRSAARPGGDRPADRPGSAGAQGGAPASGERRGPRDGGGRGQGHNQGQRGGGPASGERHGSGQAGQGDRRGGNPGDRAGAGERRGGAPGQSADRRGRGGQQGSRPAPAAPANSAMADALRRAGLLNDKDGGSAKQDRRSDRP